MLLNRNILRRVCRSNVDVVFWLVLDIIIIIIIIIIIKQPYCTAKGCKQKNHIH